MKKLREMNIDEMSVAICRMAEPIANLVEDGAVMDAFRAMAEKGKAATNMLQNMGAFLSTLVPVLLGDKHRQDTLAVMAAVCGQSVEELKVRNGMDVIKDLHAMLTADTDVVPLFRPDEEARGE